MLSRKLSLPILVALVLLLNAASEALPSQPTQTPKRFQAAKSENAQVTHNNEVRDQYDDTADQSAFAKPQPIAVPIASPTQNGDHQAQIEGRLTLFTGLLVVVGVLQFAAACFQYRAAKKSADSTESSALAAQSQLQLAQATNVQSLAIAKDSVEAAKQSAEATRQNVAIGQLALQADRPYLLVEEARLLGVIDRDGEGIEPNKGLLSISNSLLLLKERLKKHRDFFPEATFTFKNYGKGPALIQDCKATVAAVETLPQPRDFSDCSKVDAHPQGISVGERLIIKGILSLKFLDGSDEKIEAIRHTQKLLVVYGRLKYTDVSRNPYETGFFWVFKPPTPFAYDPSGTPFSPLGTEPIPSIPHTFSPVPDAHNYSE